MFFCNFIASDFEVRLPVLFRSSHFWFLVTLGDEVTEI